ncbi:MAG: type II toxin-antitoxin system VapC family toxin [Anaerolineae bacterium]|jgi:predicted nucleic acid-binding protein
MIVVDTNIIAYLYLASERSAQVEQAYRKDPHWSAPILWRSEFRNVLALYIRKQILSIEEALQIIEQATLLMRGREYQVASFQGLELVASSTCSAYDCEFVALAKDLNTSLVTVDKQILRQFPTVAISLDTFVAS